MKPQLSQHFLSRQPSAIRLALISFAKRTDGVKSVNAAIGNVSLPMHPALQKRMFNLKDYYKDGVLKYSSTVGSEETQKAFLNIIASSGFDTKKLYVQITDGGSKAMDLLVAGLCGPAGIKKKPLLLIDPAYTNYKTMAERMGRSVISVKRKLDDNGEFTLPSIDKIEAVIKKHKPSGILAIPYDNPTGQFFDMETMVKLGELVVKHNIWLATDEAYRELQYTSQKTSSIWGLNESNCPGITGRRISIESASKVWNACGLRMGAIITDNQDFNEKSIADATATLCPNVIGQYIFGALAHEKHSDLKKWYEKQRNYYQKMISRFRKELLDLVPGIIVSKPDAALYSVVDVKNIVNKSFKAKDFALYCAAKGKVKLKGGYYTLLVSPMSGFYSCEKGEENPGRTQMRIAYVETPENLEKGPVLLQRLLRQYLKK